MNDTWRKWFPVSSRITYLNHAGVAPLSTRAAAAMETAVRECTEWGAFRYGRLLNGIRRARGSAAELLEVHPDHVAFVKNTSEGVSFVAEGFPWKAGDAVVVPEGEFPSNVYPWMNLARRGVRVIRVPERGGRLDMDDYRRAVSQRRVRLLAVSAVEYGTGFRNDLAALGELCRKRGVLFFVDAIQALGCIPLAPERLGIHALAADGHKWLCGPEGIGLLYLSREALERLHPVEVGWNSVQDPMAFDRIRFELRPDAARFEAGSPSTVAVHGLGAALELLLEVGIARVWARVQELWGGLIEGLRERSYSVASPLAPRERSGILTFVPRRKAPTDLAAGFHVEGVFVAARGPGVRVSPHFYNTTEDLERFFAALDRLDREG